MEKKTFKVPNMTCNGCAGAVRGEVEQLAGVVDVNIDLPTQLVTVEWNAPASWDTIEKALVEIEYPPVEA
jgi:copper chaperone